MNTILASWFGSGLLLHRIRGSHLGSGTLASVVTFPLAVWIGRFGFGYQVGATVGVVLLALWSIQSLVATEGDAGWIVIDEAAGTFLAVISLTWIPALIGLIVFRLADIYKHRFPGVARAENAPAAVGILADDLVAGFYGLAAGLLADLFVS